MSGSPVPHGDGLHSRRRPGGRRGRIDLSVVALAVIFLVSGGIGYRALGRYLDRPSNRTTLNPGVLARLPFQIGDWAGTDVAMDDAVVRAADVDDYVSRQYVRATDHETVKLWLAFGVRARDLMPHRPEVCYPGAGWTLSDQNTIVLHGIGGEAVRARVLGFASGGLDQSRLTVLNYYFVDGETCEDVSLLRSKAWRGQTSIRYMAQIQIVRGTNAVGQSVQCGDVVRDFATASFPHIRNLLEESTRPPTAGQ
jgi:EpsI family protein